jgi:hypothetical protein
MWTLAGFLVLVLIGAAGLSLATGDTTRVPAPTETARDREQTTTRKERP